MRKAKHHVMLNLGSDGCKPEKCSSGAFLASLRAAVLRRGKHLFSRSRTKFGMTGIVLFFILSPLISQPVPGSYHDFIDATKDMPAGHDKTSLIIYRPDNEGVLNDIRCFLRIEDENGNDITYDKKHITATYEWMSTPDIIRNYKHTYFLSGGMAMHLKLKKGRYKISLYTPVNQQNNFTYSEADAKPFQWESNVFEYNTENPAKVIFVTPTRNDNGFYNGGWIIDYKNGRKP